MIAAKAFFSVTAGILLDEPMPEYSHQWGYTSQDYADDAKRLPEEQTIFVERRESAIAFARDVINPDAVNWVRLEFVWL